MNCESARAIGGAAVEEALALARSLVRALAAEPLVPRRPLPPMHLLVPHFEAQLAHEPIEQLRALFVDGGQCIIVEETLWHGTIDEAPFFPREIVHRALELGAASLLLVHNHPSGRSEASGFDLKLTHSLVQTCRPLRLHIIDHLIVSRSGTFSMRTAGLLQPKRS